MDDAVFEHSFLKTWILVKLASAVTCGSMFIFEWAKKHNKNSFYFLNSLPPDIYASRHGSGSDIPVIGWAGDGPAHFENLKLLPPIFERLIADGLRFKFTLIGALGDGRVHDLFASVKGLDYAIIDRLDWSDPRNVAREIAQFDIGIMPMIENRWNKAKYFKTLEYMACGVPALAGDFGENTHIIENGENGFLLKDGEEWYQKLKLLISDKDLRIKLGKRGLETIKERFSLEKATARLINTLIQSHLIEKE
ncbi:glycosyltransferase family 4 protein [Patescibacteria group bacterium]|nr:glycosyltransferase family 4 protein [Patescibacteria group bacterium]